MTPKECKQLMLLLSDLNRDGLMRSTLSRLGALVMANPGDFGIDIETLQSHVGDGRVGTPWVDLGISRATWYRRRKAGTP